MKGIGKLARDEAVALSCEGIGTEHLLLAVLREEGAGAALLRSMGLDLAVVRAETERLFAGRPSKKIEGQLPYSPRAKNCLEAAAEAARVTGREAESDHLVAGLMTEPEGGASKVLTALGVTRGSVMRALGAGLLGIAERREIARLWARKLDQDAKRLAQSQRHRNLAPDSAEFVCALAAGLRAKRIVEIGGSSGLSTIALAAAARATGGRVTSIEIEPERQAEARETIGRLGMVPQVEFVLADAAGVLPGLEAVEFALVDCEKDDYIRFFELLRLAPGAVVVADNILSHGLTEYVAHVRSKAGASSITLPVGKGLEVTRIQ
jgi:predicted O-methyltransferase YrrM